MFTFDIITEPNFSYSTQKIDAIFAYFSKMIDIPTFGILNIVFVTSDEIRSLNAQYRQKNSVTDVLSFHYFEDFSDQSAEDIVGEMVFCEEKIFSQAQEYGIAPEREFYKLLIHSLLHIVGYDHEDDDDFHEMNILEQKIAQAVFGEYV